MGKGRLEAFSDGVIAVIITIMVLEMKVPHGLDLTALEPVIPVFVSYLLSFVYVGIYWNSHHYMPSMPRWRRCGPLRTGESSARWANDAVSPRGLPCRTLVPLLAL
jgi:hypothetical protein